MVSLLDWLATHESALSATAALIAIVAGVGVSIRLLWTRMPSTVKRPGFLSDWRNIGLICVTGLALTLLLVLTFGDNSSETSAVLSDLGGKPSVAVLPLDNISGDPEQEYLADGIAEDVITLLSRNPRFFVIARNSSFTYKGKAVDIRQVGEELGVRYVVEGSLRKIGGQLRVTIQLIDTSDGRHIWAAKYDRPYTEIFELQDDITNGIAVALGDGIFQAEIARAMSTSTDNLDAWGFMMRASQALTSWNNTSSLQATTLLRSALDLDPNYAVAKAELARTLCWRLANGFSGTSSSDIEEAYGLAEQAQQAAPNDPLVLFGVGGCYAGTGRPDDAIRLLKNAVTKQPNFAIALAFLDLAYALSGQPELGQAYSEKALALSPQSPYIYLYESWRTFGLLELGDYVGTESAAQNALQAYDGWWWTWLHLAAAHAGQGKTDSARDALFMARAKEPQFSLAYYRRSAAIIYKNKGKNVLGLLEPIWPEDLLTTDEGSEK